MLEDESEVAGGDWPDWDPASANAASSLPSSTTPVLEQPHRPIEYYTERTTSTTTRITQLKRPGPPQDADTARAVSEAVQPISEPTESQQQARFWPHVTTISVLSDEDSAPVEYIPETLGTLPRGAHVQSVVTVQSELYVPRGQLLHVTAVLDPDSGRRLSLEQALRAGVLDLTPAAANFNHRPSGRKMSLPEAVAQGWMDGAVLKQLQQKCDLQDPSTSRDLTVLDALRRGYFNPTSGEVTNPHTGEKLSLHDAVEQRLLSRDTAVTLSYVNIVASSTSRLHGFYEVNSMRDTGVTLTLADALEKGLYNGETGKLVDPVSNDEMSIQEAIQLGLLDPYAKDLVHPVTGEKLNVEEAVAQGVLDPQSGQFIDPRSGRKVTLEEAAARSLILKPISLGGAITQGLLEESGLIRDIRTGRKLTLPEAVDKGILDADVKCVLDPRTRELLSLEEAMERGVITQQGEYVDPRSGRRMPVQVRSTAVRGTGCAWNWDKI